MITMRGTVRSSVDMSMGLFLLSLQGSGLHPFTVALFKSERMEGRI